MRPLLLLLSTAYLSWLLIKDRSKLIDPKRLSRTEMAKPLSSVGPRNVAFEVLRHLWFGMGYVEVEVTIATADAREGIDAKSIG